MKMKKAGLLLLAGLLAILVLPAASVAADGARFGDVCPVLYEQQGNLVCSIWCTDVNGNPTWAKPSL